MLVLFLVAPSGLWTAFRAEAGPIAVVGFATLTVVTGLFIAIGWRSAVRRRFAEHRLWMWRCFLALCSAVVLRLIVGLATVTRFQNDWLEPVVAWASWLLPLAACELSRRATPSIRRLLAHTCDGSVRFLSAELAPAARRALISISGGDEVGDF